MTRETGRGIGSALISDVPAGSSQTMGIFVRGVIQHCPAKGVSGLLEIVTDCKRRFGDARISRAGPRTRAIQPCAAGRQRAFSGGRNHRISSRDNPDLFRCFRRGRSGDDAVTAGAEGRYFLHNSGAEQCWADF